MAEKSATFFNGGKMLHIFAFNEETRKYETDGTFTSPVAEQALLHGVMYYKIDGSNGMVQVIYPKSDSEEKEEPILKLYQRLDTRGKNPAEMKDGNDMLTSLPEGRNACEYPGHSYYYDQITDNVTGKKLIKRNRAMMELVERHRDKFVAMGREWCSVEWVGTMFNKTPNVPHAVALAIHQDQMIDEEGDQSTVERTFEGIRKYLLEDCEDHPVEGLILEHEGVYWKIRSDCFPLPKGTKDPFKKNRDNSRPPVFLV